MRVYMAWYTYPGGDFMRFRYKIDVLSALRDAGYSTYRIRREKLLAESTLQKLRGGDVVSLDQIGVICDLLKMSPWELIEYERE